MSPIKVGFVGLSSSGWASTCLAPGLLNSPSYTLTAVSTTNAESAAASAKKYTELAGHAVKPYWGSTEQVANDPEVQLVVVAIKAPGHKAAALPAIEAGKDVFVEWPAGQNTAATLEIAAAAKAKGVKTVVGLQGRQAGVVKKTKEILESGKIGRILSSSITMKIAQAPGELGFWGPTVNQRNIYTLDRDGGATMLDIAIGHQLDVVTHLLGPITSVSATTALQFPTATVIDAEHKPTSQTIRATGPDHVAFSGLFASGALASVVWRGGIKSTPGRKQFIWQIDGEEGSVRMESDELGGAFLHIRNPTLYLNGEVPQTSGPADNLTSAWEAFARGEEYPTIEDAVKNHRLLDAIATSAQEGRTVHL
ncbi:hypothetical protein HWV62_8343 [Athelia sp. TMB]|nr:hypothetical protein HWV62_8343 [Athelia sp. TMB]